MTEIFGGQAFLIVVVGGWVCREFSFLPRIDLTQRRKGADFKRLKTTLAADLHGFKRIVLKD